ncbi:MAG: hypothetical protein LBQ76_01580 [Candidatus Fibromonas sp.]|jgi:hypothetical protein|nr:hypothetical protein [Candidatus Fibromonas sp.]
MKRFLLLLSLAFISVNLAFGQTAKKKPPVAPAPKAANKAVVVQGTAPKLETKDPSFTGFTGSFVSFGNISGEDRSFTMKVEYKPWFFEASGTANAKYNTPDLGEDVIVVIAYYNALGKTADSTSYQAGLFDLMMYLDDEPVKISNLNFTMTAKAAAGSAVLAQAKTWNFEQGKVFKMPKYDAPIIKAQAAALDKSDIAREEAAAKKREADSIAKEKKRVSDSIAKVEKMKKDSIAKEKKRVSDSIAKVEKMKQDSIAKVEKARKDSIAAYKKYVKDSVEKAEQDKKKAAAAAKKKKKVVEEDEEEDEPPKKKTSSKKKKKAVEEDEEEEPPVKKKTTSKKKKFEVVEDDEDWDEEPPKKKSSKKKK